MQRRLPSKDMSVHTTERLHALDAVRGFALIAGVVLHATMSFLPGFGAQGWPLTDDSSSVTLGVTFYVIHIFRMTTFFVIAGFFGRVLLHRSGVRAFVSNRSTRVMIPLVVGWIVFFPMVATAMVWAARRSRRLPAKFCRRAALSFPLAHLWFLYVLTLMYAAALIVRQGVIGPIDRTGHLREWVDRATATPHDLVGVAAGARRAAVCRAGSLDQHGRGGSASRRRTRRSYRTCPRWWRSARRSSSGGCSSGNLTCCASSSDDGHSISSSRSRSLPRVCRSLVWRQSTCARGPVHSALCALLRRECLVLDVRDPRVSRSGSSPAKARHGATWRTRRTGSTSRICRWCSGCNSR